MQCWYFGLRSLKIMILIYPVITGQQKLLTEMDNYCESMNNEDRCHQQFKHHGNRPAVIVSVDDTSVHHHPSL